MAAVVHLGAREAPTQTLAMNDLVGRLAGALGGRYVPVREIGRGGNAVVVLAHDCRHDRDVAIKVLLPELAASLGPDRFLREIQIEAGLQHPHILPLYDSGAVDGLPFYVMPYVQGESLRQRLDRERQLSMQDALQITREVAEALEYAHRQNVVHRDVKPANILLVDGHAIVADFGLARAITMAGHDDITATGLAVGTPAYMSPEQASAESWVDGRTDIYALACVLYEMLAGEPPFTGTTVRAVAARHMHDPPPSLRVVRPAVPLPVDRALIVALAKVPADRFSTVSEFVAALTDETAVARPRSSLRRSSLLAGAVLALVGFGLWRQLDGGEQLDPHRVVVFPLEEPNSSDNGGEGEAVATYIGYALEASDPLRWLEGARLTRGDGPAAAAVSREAQARFFIDGLIVRAPDSVRIVLRLHDVAGDSLLARAGAAGDPATASLPQLGLRAVSALLPVLLEPGRRVDMTPFSDRRPVAVARFLQGEREYRQAHFATALEHYMAATREDSAFALAALKGSQAAGWLGRDDVQATFAELAARNDSLLPPRYRPLARAQLAYTAGRADTAVAYLRSALAADSSRAEAWMALAEVYYHLLPREGPPDSLAEAALLRARAADAEFNPPVFHLAEIAFRRGDVAVGDRLLDEFQREQPDSSRAVQLQVMAECVRQGSSPERWRRVVAAMPEAALESAKALSGILAHPQCAEDGFRATLAGAEAENLRWGALLGLQSLLVAQGRTTDLVRLLDSDAVAPLGGTVLYLLDAASGADVAAKADTVAAREGEQYSTMSTPMLWLLGSWHARRMDASRIVRIAAAMRAKADSSRNRRDSLLLAAIDARAALVQGDTTVAMQRLDALSPTAPRVDLAWQPWESLGLERALLAELLLARGRHREALHAAKVFDSPQPLVYLLFLGTSLRIRERASASLGLTEQARAYRRRLVRLQHRQPIADVRPAANPTEE